MKKSVLSATLCLGVAAAASSPAAAQVAAEEAAILSGSSGKGSPQRALGETITGAINSASEALRASNNASSANTSSNGNRNRAGYAGTLPIGDPLENTDAKTYQVQNGGRIKLSGSFRPSKSTSCEEKCVAPSTGEAAEAEAEAETEVDTKAEGEAEPDSESPNPN